MRCTYEISCIRHIKWWKKKALNDCILFDKYKNPIENRIFFSSEISSCEREWERGIERDYNKCYAFNAVICSGKYKNIYRKFFWLVDTKIASFFSTIISVPLSLLLLMQNREKKTVSNAFQFRCSCSPNKISILNMLFPNAYVSMAMNPCTLSMYKNLILITLFSLYIYTYICVYFIIIWFYFFFFCIRVAMPNCEYSYSYTILCERRK